MCKSDVHDVNQKRVKGERETHRKPNISMYPIAKSDSGSEPTVEDYQTFSALRNPKGRRTDKTNLTSVRILRMRGPMAYRAEDYCKLRTRLENELWNRMKGKCDVWSKARDFASVTEPEAVERTSAERLFTSHIANKAIKLEQGGTEIPGGATTIPTNCRMGDLDIFIKAHPQPISWRTAVFKTDPLDVASALDAKQLMERLYWEMMAREIFRSPHDAYTTQIEYLQHDVRKPYSEKFTHFKHRMEELFSYLKYFPAPCKRSSFPTNLDMDLRDRAIERDVIRRAIYNALPKSWHLAYEKRTPEDVLGLTEEEFMTMFNTIEEEDLRERESQDAQKERAKSDKNKNGKRPADASNNGTNGGEKDNNKKLRTSKFCKKCKEAGRSQAAYTSHNGSECTWKGKTSAQSSLTSNSNSEFQKMRKEFKAMKKMLAALDKKKSPTKHKQMNIRDPYNPTPDSSDDDE